MEDKNKKVDVYDIKITNAKGEVLLEAKNLTISELNNLEINNFDKINLKNK